MANRIEMVRLNEWDAVDFGYGENCDWVFIEGEPVNGDMFVPRTVVFSGGPDGPPIISDKMVSFGCDDEIVKKIVEVLESPEDGKIIMISDDRAVRLEEEEGAYYFVQGWLGEDRFIEELIVRECGPEKVPKICPLRVKVGGKKTMGKVIHMVKSNFHYINTDC